MKLSFIPLPPGMYILCTRGPSSSQWARVSQYTGTLVSLLSATKGVAEWHLFSAYNVKFKYRKIRASLLTSLKSLLFFLPHSLFKLASLSLCAAFLGYYFLLPLTLIIGIQVVGAAVIYFREEDRNWRIVLAIPVSIISPTVDFPQNSTYRALLKLSLLSSPVILLPSLLITLLLPHLLSPSSLLCTPGLSHLHLSSPPPACSPCFTPQATTPGDTSPSSPRSTSATTSLTQPVTTPGSPLPPSQTSLQPGVSHQVNTTGGARIPSRTISDFFLGFHVLHLLRPPQVLVSSPTSLPTLPWRRTSQVPTSPADITL